MNLISESNIAESEKLEKRLADFYSTTDDYRAFQEQSRHPHMWELILDQLRKDSGKNKFRILEIGAGRSGLYKYLSEKVSPEIRERMHLCCQDITRQNVAYLQENSHEVLIGDIHSVDGQWDVITHSYVLEHVVRPQAFLSRIYNLLCVGGHHIFQCPRYDLPIYTPPSLDHLKIYEKSLIMMKRCLGSKPFRIIDDPSVFYLPFSRDRDAVHLVSKKDITNLHIGYGEVRSFKIPTGSFKDFIVKNYLTLKMQIVKTENKTMEIYY